MAGVGGGELVGGRGCDAREDIAIKPCKLCRVDDICPRLHCHCRYAEATGSELDLVWGSGRVVENNEDDETLVAKESGARRQMFVNRFLRY